MKRLLAFLRGEHNWSHCNWCSQRLSHKLDRFQLVMCDRCFPPKVLTRPPDPPGQSYELFGPESSTAPWPDHWSI